MSKIETREKSFKNTLAFVTDERVSSVPIDTKVQIPSRHRNMNQTQWERRWEVVGEYLGTDKILEEVSRDSDITEERVRQIVKQGVKQLHRIQSAEVKSEFPLDQFSYRKPLPVSSRRRYSEAHGGSAVRIEQALLEGKTVPQIKKDFKPMQIFNARRTLGKWGIEIPYELSPILPRFEKLRDPKLYDEEKQKLLDSVEHANNSVLKVLSSGEEPFTIPVFRIGWEAGLFFRTDKVNIIYALLRSKGVPASYFSYFVRSRRGNKEKKRYTYYFICATDRDRAVEIIKGAEELDQFKVNPVTILGKATDRIPRVGELINSGNYSRVWALVNDIRGRPIGRHGRTEDIFLDDCPVSIFKHHVNIFYRLDQQEQLREYLRGRLKELGLI